MTNFDKAFDALLGNEGGYVNRPSDPGGETNWGISKRSYPDVDIKNLTKDGAKAIYLRDFWNPLKLDQMTYDVAFEMFDAAVNHGPTKAIMLVQQAVGVADDGHAGPVTMKAIQDTDRNDILLRFNGYRLKFYTKLSTWNEYGRGFANRVADNLIRDSYNN